MLDFARAQRRLDRMARQVPLDRPWDAPKAAEWDSMTARTWLRRATFARRERGPCFELGIEAVWAAQPEDFSLLHMLFYIHSAGGLDMLFDTEGGAQQDRFVGGSQLVAERLAERLGPETVVRDGAPVRRIEHGPGGVTAAHADGQAVHARRAVVAIAPSLAGRIAYDPPLVRASRPAHPADAARHGGQVHGALPRALLARRGPQRPGRRATRAR